MLYSKRWPGRLGHHVPHWVDTWTALYHIRMRIDRDAARRLVDPDLAPLLLASVTFYTRRRRWWPHVFLLMPDHLHAVLSFPGEDSMSRVVSDWKSWHARTNGVLWQAGFFDHRLRHGESLEHTIDYIRQNPVALGLCKHIEDWPWRLSGPQIADEIDVSDQEPSRKPP